MASGMDMMLKSMLGIDPDMIKQGAAEMQQALQNLIAQYKADQAEQRVIMARIEAKLDMLIAEREETQPARIISDEEYERLVKAPYRSTLGGVCQNG